MGGARRPAVGTGSYDGRAKHCFGREFARVLASSGSTGRTPTRPGNSWRVRLLLFAGAALSIFLLLAAAAPAPRAEAMLLPPPAGSASEAVRLAVQSLGETYFGVCGAARSPEDLHKVCSRFVAERGDQEAYLLGRTFSEYNTWLFIERAPDGWRFLRTEGFTVLDSLSDIPWPCDCAAPNV